MKLMPIIYDEKIQREIMQYAFLIYETSKKWLAESKECYNLEGKIILKTEREQLFKKFFIVTIEEIISFFKHPAFEDEREIRWLYRFDRDFIKECKFKFKMKKFNDKNYYTSFDAHNMSYLNCYSLDNKLNIQLPIKSIILGSKIKDSKKVISEVKKCCYSFGFQDIDVKVSDIPYQ